MPVVVLLPGVEPGADRLDGLAVAGNGQAVAQGEAEEREDAGDAVGEPVVAVAAGRVGRGPLRWRRRPPAGQAVQRVGEAHEVGEDVVDEVAGGVVPPQVRSEAGEPADQVVLGDRRALARAEAVAGFVELAAGDGLDAPVGDRAGGGVSGVAGGIECERERGRAVVEAAAGAGVEPVAGRCGQPVVGRRPVAVGDGPFDVEERDAGGAVAGQGRGGHAGGRGRVELFGYAIRGAACLLVELHALLPLQASRYRERHGGVGGQERRRRRAHARGHGAYRLPPAAGGGRATARRRRA